MGILLQLAHKAACACDQLIPHSRIATMQLLLTQYTVITKSGLIMQVARPWYNNSVSGQDRCYAMILASHLFSPYQTPKFDNPCMVHAHQAF